jgi:thienamycin biosynthesis protein ThnO
VGPQQQGHIRIPAIINGGYYYSLEEHTLTSTCGRTLGKLTQTPLIKTHELIGTAGRNIQQLQKIPAATIFAAFRAAARLIRQADWSFAALSRHAYSRLVSCATGLPQDAMDTEIEELADLLDHMEEVVAVQLPACPEQSLDQHRFQVPGNTIGYYPSGDTLLVKIPGNIPTIAVYWLTPLAMKRPVILVPSHEDPYTHFILAEAIRAVHPVLGACIQFMPCTEHVLTRLMGAVGQALLPESDEAIAIRSGMAMRNIHFIHYGRTKLLIQGAWQPSGVDVAFRRMTWKYGRTCTGLTSVIVQEDGEGFCLELSKRIEQAYPGHPDINLHRLPLLTREKARQINDWITSCEQRGEVVDMTARHGQRPRLLEVGDCSMLLPTVLLIKQRGSKIFGTELPFPFITVIECNEVEECIGLARNSLILGVITTDKNLLDRLYAEPSILKIFSGAHVERGYHYLDPHEGFLADFLYQKKAIAD